MRQLFAGALAVLFIVAPALAAGPEPKTEDQKVLYALGMSVRNSLASFNLNEAELEMVKAGLSDNGKDKKIDLQSYGPKIQELVRSRMAAAAADEKKSAETFLTKAATEKGATKTTSGLIVTVIKPGTGPSPKATDKVKVHYHGTLVDGTVFDSSVERKEPVVLALNQVIRCWTEGVQTMKVGGKSKFVCPSSIAYGDRGAPPKIKPGATLVFEVELLGIEK